MGDAYNHFVCKDYPVLFRRTCSLRHLGEMGGDLGKERACKAKNAREASRRCFQTDAS